MAIEEALKTTKGMVVVLSPDAVASQNVMDEVSYALDERKLIVPVTIRTCDIPFRLRRVQRVDFTLNYDLALVQLRMALDVQSATSVDPVSPPHTQPRHVNPNDEHGPDPTRPAQSPSADHNHTQTTAAAAAMSTQAPTSSLGHNVLDVGTKVSEFEILGLIGEGGFGIVYLTYDRALDRRVALREYMPALLAHRAVDGTVIMRSDRHAETFTAGMRSFMNEARLLAQFDHPSLVKVYRFWEANGTAYMAMPFYEGATLKQALNDLDAAPDEAWLRLLLAHLFDALEIIHNRQCYHHDIAPDNILIRADGTPLLLDFGAAKRVIGDMTQALTVILKPGYAPIEQYADVPNMKQGPWTDLYALAAVVYFTITGHAPMASVARIVSDPMVPLSEVARGRYSDGFLETVDWALCVKPDDRPQNIAEFRAALRLPTSIKSNGLEMNTITPPTRAKAASLTDPEKRSRLWGWFRGKP